MKTVYPIKVQAPGQLEGHGDIKLVITGQAIYYLRCYSDGTFEVFGQDGGDIKAIVGVGYDGAVVAGASLAAHLDRFCADNEADLAN